MNSNVGRQPGTPGAAVSERRTTYCFGTARIDVSVDEADTARWLFEFFSPWFSTGPSSGTGLRVRATHSREEFAAAARRETAGNLRLFPCFRLDSSLVSLPGWMESDRTTFIADREWGCYYRLQDDQVRVIARPRDLPARLGLMRVLRELATSQASALPEMLDLHAAAFGFGGHAILLTGEKRTGKTTLLSHALTSRETSLIANDRVMVDGERLQAFGVPTIVSVREETEAMFPSLGRIHPRRAVFLNERELALRPTDTGTERRLSLSLAQLARQLGSPLSSSAPVGAILFPQISPSLSGLLLQPLHPSEAVECLRGSVYARRLAPHDRTVFQEMTNAFPHDSRDFHLSRLAAAVPLMRCLLGPDAYGKHPGDWLKTLRLRDGTNRR